MIRGHVRTLNEEIPVSLAHIEIEALEPARRRRIQRRRDAYERVYRELIDEGIEIGVFRAVDSKVAALAILGAVNWTVKWFHVDGAKTAGEIGAEFAELAVRGLLAKGTEIDLGELPNSERACQ